MPLSPGDAYGYAAFTDPAHRRRGAASVLYVTRMRQVRDEGYRRAVAYVVRENTSGRVPLLKLGFERVGRIRSFHVGRVGVELLSRRDERPRLRLHVRPARAQE